MTTGNQLFSKEQRQLLTAVLNRIIPAEGQMPGAGDLGLASFIEESISGDVRKRRLFLEGLAQTEITAAQRQGKDFLELSDDGKDAVLKEVQDSLGQFFQELISQTYNEYYTNAQVFALIGYAVPRPQEYQPRPLPEDLLETQRQRAPFWRRV